MLVILWWGKRRTEQSMGYVADFCPIDRSIQAFRVDRIGVASHLYGIALGEGKLAGHLIVCEECGTASPGDISKYQDVSQCMTSVEALTATTFPAISDAYRDRLAIEERVRSNPRRLDSETRLNLIRESFLILNHEVEAQNTGDGEMHLNPKQYLGCGVLMMLQITLFALGLYLADGGGNDLVGGLVVWASLIMVPIGIGYAIYLRATAPKRLFSKTILPRLVMALDPLQPTKAELDDCLGYLKTMKLRIARIIKSDRLLPGPTGIQP